MHWLTFKVSQDFDIYIPVIKLLTNVNYTYYNFNIDWMCNKEPTSKFDTTPFIWFVPYTSFHITLYVLLQIRIEIYIHYV